MGQPPLLDYRSGLLSGYITYELVLAMGLGYGVLTAAGALATGWLLCFFDIECFSHQQRLWVGAAAAVLGCAYGAGRMVKALKW